jgi:protein-disulfide isomerase
MARKKSSPPKNSVPVAAFVEPLERKAPVRSTQEYPYSLTAMLDFMTNNAGLIFLGLSLLIVGFLTGAMWRENTMLKAGYVGGGTPTAQAPGANAPTAAAPDAAPAQPLSDETWKQVQENPAGVIGNKNAKVTIVEFTDYQCPYCSRHFTATYPQLKKKYVDSGKVKIVLKDQPLPFHPNSKISAAAARCGGEQGKFEAMHDALFGKQNDWANLSNDDAIKKFGDMAKEVGLNGDKLMSCVKDGKFTKAIEADSVLGLKPEVGAGGTPTFFIQKTPVVGAQDLSVFEAEIEKALKS